MFEVRNTARVEAYGERDPTGAHLRHAGRSYPPPRRARGECSSSRGRMVTAWITHHGQSQLAAINARW